MPSLTQRVTLGGLRLPRELLEQWGAHEGQQLSIDLTRECIRISPLQLSPAEVGDRAATYVFDHVGDAAAAGAPVRDTDGWRVPVTLSYRARSLGRLTYSASGDLILTESDSPATMRERAREA